MVTLSAAIETNHEDVIHSAELDCYGTYLATCSSDNIIKVFEIKSNAQMHIADLKGHAGPVWDISWAHPKFGNILASCSYDRKVIIWKKAGSNWQKLYEQNSESSVNSVEWAPNEFGMILACASSDGSILILTFNTETNNWELEKISNAHAIGCNSLSWCPETVSGIFKNLKPLGNSVYRRLVSGGCDNCIKIWMEKNGRWVEENRLEAHSDWVRHVNWAPSYGTCKTQIASASQDRHVIIWTSSNMLTWTPLTLNIFEDVPWSTSWSLTGRLLAVTGSDNKVSLWKENNSQWSAVSCSHN